MSNVNVLTKSLEHQCLYIIYGSHLSPKIEKIKFSDLNESNKVTVLKRDDPFKTSVSLQIESTKIETPSISKDLKVLVSGFVAPQVKNHLTLNNNNAKRKSVESSQVTKKKCV